MLIIGAGIKPSGFEETYKARRPDAHLAQTDIAICLSFLYRVLTGIWDARHYLVAEKALHTCTWSDLNYFYLVIMLSEQAVLILKSVQENNKNVAWILLKLLPWQICSNHYVFPLSLQS